MYMLDPVLMLGPFNDSWMEFYPEVLKAEGVQGVEGVEVTVMDVAEMLVCGSPNIVLAGDSDTPREKLLAAVERSYKNREEAARRAAEKAKYQPQAKGKKRKRR
jgi:hypothetical protein